MKNFMNYKSLGKNFFYLGCFLLVGLLSANYNKHVLADIEPLPPEPLQLVSERQASQLVISGFGEHKVDVDQAPKQMWLQHQEDQECESRFFTGDDETSNDLNWNIDNEMSGTGLTINLKPEDGNKTFCFYVRTADGRQGLESFKVGRPLISVTRTDNQLVAAVINPESDNIVVDEESWKWRQFSEEEEVGKSICQEDSSQPDFKNGEGSTVDIGIEDKNSTFCFYVWDVAGIKNTFSPGFEVGKDINITPVIDTDINPTEPINNEVNNLENENSNLIPWIGGLILLVAVAAGGWMIYKSSTTDEPEESYEDILEEPPRPQPQKTTAKKPTLKKATKKKPTLKKATKKATKKKPTLKK